MTTETPETTDWFANLRDALYRFACGPWPPPGQPFKWKTYVEVERALKMIDQLEGVQARMERDAECEAELALYAERAARLERRKRREKKSAAIVTLPPPKNGGAKE
jgi:hypothetical protein